MMRRSLIGWMLAAASVLLVSQSSVLRAADGTEVRATQSAMYGWILADAEGMSLYLYTEDNAGDGGPVSNCNEACTRNWPPLLVEGELVAGEGVDAGLLGTLVRQDGSPQAIYNGWPLYRSVRDARPGDIRGQRLGGVFFLVSPEGNRVTEEVVRQVEVDPELLAVLTSEGGRIFASNCAVCHGQAGEGLVGPRLANNAAVGRTEFIVNRILDGFPEHGMPAWRDILSDREIAAVATFVRNSWSNDFGPVLEEEVSDLR